MKWTSQTPSMGDMVRVHLGEIYHYGVFVSEAEIIQFGLPPVARAALSDADIAVCSSNMPAFLCGGKLEVACFEQAESATHRSPSQVVSYARAKIGSRGYHILYNNCEHFAYDCVTGKPYCSQTTDLRALFRAMPLVDVYTARIPQSLVFTTLYPSCRQEEMIGITNDRVKAEKWCVWKLLEYALERSLGLKMKNLELYKNECGKWLTDKCFFSLSHCNGVVAVAVSRKEVGLDIEEAHPSLHQGFAQKILNGQELSLYEQTETSLRTRFLLEAWTAKESLFKRNGEAKTFIPTAFDTLLNRVHTRSVVLDEKEYVLSVATETPDVLRFYSDIDLLSKL